MFIGTNGIVLDEEGRILLILRDDTHTWAIPGGALEAGELPTEGVVREVLEETGFSTAPTQLAGVYHWYEGSQDFVVFVFRCSITGGERSPSEESLRVAFFSRDSLPSSMLNLHLERLERGLSFKGAEPYWGEQKPTSLLLVWRKLIGPLVYRWKDLRRLLSGLPRYMPPAPWTAGAFAVIQNDAGAVLWVKRADYDVWNLPGGGSESGEAPWTTAVRETYEETGLEVELTSCTGIYIKPDSNSMLFTFKANVLGGSLTTSSESKAFDYFFSGKEPENSLPKQVERVADAVSFSGEIQIRIQSGPSGLTILEEHLSDESKGG
ncbi:MAG: NUDIX domain-containing protein [Candidatus Promineifilaceae bacterium]|jgi:8-oxo-dGTP diphosphatase